MCIVLTDLPLFFVGLVTKMVRRFLWTPHKHDPCHLFMISSLLGLCDGHQDLLGHVLDVFVSAPLGEEFNKKKNTTMAVAMDEGQVKQAADVVAHHPALTMARDRCDGVAADVPAATDLHDPHILGPPSTFSATIY